MIRNLYLYYYPDFPQTLQWHHQVNLKLRYYEDDNPAKSQEQKHQRLKITSHSVDYLHWLALKHDDINQLPF